MFKKGQRVQTVKGSRGSGGFYGKIVRKSKWRDMDAYVVEKELDGRKVNCLERNLIPAEEEKQRKSSDIYVADGYLFYPGGAVRVESIYAIIHDRYQASSEATSPYKKPICLLNEKGKVMGIIEAAGFGIDETISAIVELLYGYQ
ncbi:MAG: hypothetical protein SVK08_00380 [Halobacteriota archaeon]|nr:hypothetical protein [Halobacteriota archaeon]